MVVPKKRTALLVNRLMVALKEAMDEDDERTSLNRVDDYPRGKSYSMTPEEIRSVRIGGDNRKK